VIQVTLSFPDKAAMLAYFADTGTTPAPVEKVEAPKPVKAAKPAATEATPPAVASAPATSSEKPSDSVDYPTLQKAVFALAGKSREAAGTVAASLGVKTFKELAEDKWGEALAAVNAKLAELEAA
jgi:hypothetical protein